MSMGVSLIKYVRICQVFIEVLSFFRFSQSESKKRSTCTYVCISVRVDMKYRLSLLQSVEEENIKTFSLSIQNDRKAIIKLIFMVFIDVIVNVKFF